MRYELWCGDVLLGHSDLAHWQMTAIPEIVAARHDSAMRLRRPDGTVIPTRHLIIQDLNTLPELSELVEEAICAGDEDAEPDFFDAPDGKELVCCLEED